MFIKVLLVILIAIMFFSEPLFSQYILQQTDSSVISIGQVYDMKASGKYLYGITDRGFYRINIEDPNHPYIKSTCWLPPGITNFCKLQLKSDYAYIGNGTAGLTVVDISDTNTLQIAATLGSLGNITKIAIKDSALYTLGDGGAKIISIKQPRTPLLLSTFDPSAGDGAGVYCLEVVGSWLFYGGTSSRIFRWSIANPYSPSGGTRLDKDWDNSYRQLLYDGTYQRLYVLQIDNSMRVYSVNPSNGSISRINQPHWSGGNSENNIAVYNNYVYILPPYDDWTYIYDLSNVSSPQLVGKIRPTVSDYSNARGVALFAGYCYLGVSSQILVFPIGGESPITRIDSRGGLGNILVNGDYFYTAGGQTGLLIYNATDKAHPQLERSIKIGRSVDKLSIDGNYLYCIAGEAVVIYNIANPANPDSVGEFRVPWKVVGSNAYCTVRDLIVQNGIGYACYDEGFSNGDANLEDKGIAVYDLSNVQNPSLVRKINTSSRVVSATTDGSHLYLAERRYYFGFYTGWNGVSKYSLSNPSNPTSVGAQGISGYPIDIAYSSDTLYITTGQIYSSSEPSSQSLTVLRANDLGGVGEQGYNNVPVNVSLNNDKLFISKGNELLVYNRNNLSTVIATKTFTFGVGDVAFNGSSIYLCNTYSLVTLNLTYPLPQVPNLETPSNNAKKIPLTPTLNWADAAGATSYGLQVSLSEDFSTIVIDTSGLQTSECTLSLGILTPDSIYYWRVNATNEGGTSAWSDTFSFGTVIIPKIIEPLNGETVLSNDLFIWHDINNATGFRLLISDTVTLTRSVIDTIVFGTQFQIPNTLLGQCNGYYWGVKAYLNGTDSSEWSEIRQFFTPPCGVELIQSGIPKTFKLDNSYPNPFNPSTTILFDVPKEEFIVLKIYNILGQEVATLVNERMTAGRYKLQWDASSFPTGLYMYRMQAGMFNEARRMILLK